jgi:nucleoside-diphosphate-sugar epimerase
LAAALGGELQMKLTGKAQIVTREKVGILMAPHLVASSDAIRADLGWKSSIEFPEGMRLAVGWYREHGWL